MTTDAPFTLDSTGVPSWMSLSTDDLPDALRSRLQSTTSAQTTVLSTSIPITHASIINTITSSAGSPLTGPSLNSALLTSVASTTTPSSSAAKSTQSTGSSTKMVLGITIPVGMIVVTLLLLSGIIIGKRMAKRDASTWVEHPAKRWWEFWKRGRGHIQLDDQEGLEVRRERFELPGEDILRELPTHVNIQEMEERREPVELPVPTPPGSLRSVRRGGSRGT